MKIEENEKVDEPAKGITKLPQIENIDMPYKDFKNYIKEWIFENCNKWHTLFNNKLREIKPDTTRNITIISIKIRIEYFGSSIFNSD